MELRRPAEWLAARHFLAGAQRATVTGGNAARMIRGTGSDIPG